jgi:hypothetical protein
MIEKAPIVRQICQIAKYSPLRASHTISQMRQCRGAASSLGYFPIGVAVEDAGNGATSVNVRLDGVSTAAA